jgi:hypothetical protein
MAMGADRRSSHLSFPCRLGMRSSAIRPTPTPSSIASFTTPTASSCRARAYDERGGKAPNQLDQKPQPMRQISSADGTRRPGGIIPLQGGAIIPESPGGIIPLKTGAFIGIGRGGMKQIDSTHSALKGLCDSAAVRVAMVVNEAIDRGYLRRADIVRVGKVTQQQAAVDLREIRKRFPDLLDYDPSSRRYVLLNEAVEPRWLDVSGVRYMIHAKPGSPDFLRVEYCTGFSVNRQWLAFAHPSRRAREEAGIWWRRMGGELPIPSTPQEGIDRANELRVVVGVQIKSSGPYPEIIGHRLAPDGAARLKEGVA